jgi:hypothetical protein
MSSAKEEETLFTASLSAAYAYNPSTWEVEAGGL